MEAATVLIERRFCGPPESGQGGYVCGLLAREIDGAAEVSLRVPPPLERELTVERDGEDRLLRDGDVTVGEGAPATLELDVPAPVALSDAQAAAAGYSGFRVHAFPTCFACGPDRADGDGLRLFPGPVEGRDLVACPWTPDPSLADERGDVRTELVWAALDCPTFFACDTEGRAAVLARLAGRIDAPVRASEPHVVTAWQIGREGRKHHSACAISTPAGDVLAVSRALWVELKDPSAFNVASA